MAFRMVRGTICARLVGWTAHECHTVYDLLRTFEKNIVDLDQVESNEYE